MKKLSISLAITLSLSLQIASTKATVIKPTAETPSGTRIEVGRPPDAYELAASINRLKEIQQALANGASKEQFDAELMEIKARFLDSKEIQDLVDLLLASVYSKEEMTCRCVFDQQGRIISCSTTTKTGESSEEKDNYEININCKDPRGNCTEVLIPCKAYDKEIEICGEVSYVVIDRTTPELLVESLEDKENHRFCIKVSK